MTDYPDLDDARLMLGAAAVILGQDHAATLALARARHDSQAGGYRALPLGPAHPPAAGARPSPRLVEEAWQGEDARGSTRAVIFEG